MIPIETILGLFDDLRAETISTLENPSGRDAFAFGEVSGRMIAIGLLRERLNEIIEQNQRGSDDNG